MIVLCHGVTVLVLRKFRWEISNLGSVTQDTSVVGLAHWLMMRPRFGNLVTKNHHFDPFSIL